MKLLHIADLHIGKRVNEFNMIEDQRYILNQILRITEETQPDAVLIAGDVYDKCQPSAEAVELLDEFLTLITSRVRKVLMISGNHDSPERLGFGSRILKKNGLHIGGVFEGSLSKVVLKDEYGKVNLYLLPFIKPAMARPYFDIPLETYDSTLRAVLSRESLPAGDRNVLLAHQFVTSGAAEPERSDSESLSLGGLDNVDVSCFEGFDYVALGHIHGPQKIGRDTVRYAGSPLKYSFSEARHKKSAVLVELGAKGDWDIRLIPLEPLRDMRRIWGPLEQLLKAGREDGGIRDYIHATLTDEEEIYDAVGKLRRVYPNLMALEFDNSRINSFANGPAYGPANGPAYGSKEAGALNISEGEGGHSPEILFREFFQLQNGYDLSLEQRTVMEEILEQASGGGAL